MSILSLYSVLTDTELLLSNLFLRFDMMFNSYLVGIRWSQSSPLSFRSAWFLQKFRLKLCLNLQPVFFCKVFFSFLYSDRHLCFFLSIHTAPAQPLQPGVTCCFVWRLMRPRFTPSQIGPVLVKEPLSVALLEASPSLLKVLHPGIGWGGVSHYNPCPTSGHR